MSNSDITALNNNTKNEPKMVLEQLQMHRTEGTQHKLLGSNTYFIEQIFMISRIYMQLISIHAFLHATYLTTVYQTLCYARHEHAIRGTVPVSKVLQSYRYTFQQFYYFVSNSNFSVVFFLPFYKDCTGSIREAFNLAFDERWNKIRLFRILEFYNIIIMIIQRNNFFLIIDKQERTNKIQDEGSPRNRIATCIISNPLKGGWNFNKYVSTSASGSG